MLNNKPLDDGWKPHHWHDAGCTAHGHSGDIGGALCPRCEIEKLEALARAVIAEGHARHCHKELHRGEGCCCFVAEAQDALGVDDAG